MKGPASARPKPLVPTAPTRRAKAFACHLAALAIVWLALAVRLFRLDFQSLWGDEAFALRLAREPFARLLPALAGSEPHPPLYYGLLHLWRGLAGESDFALRLPSALFSVLAVAAIYVLGRRLLGDRPALAAAAIAAANAFQVWYAQEMRMYALLLALTAWSSVLFLDLMEKRGRHRWLLYVAIAAASLYSHYHALFVLLFQNGVAAIYWLRRRQGARQWLAAQGVLLALFLPWVYYAQTIFRTWSGWMAPLDFWSIVARSFSTHTLGTSFPADWLVPATLALAVGSVLALGHRALDKNASPAGRGAPSWLVIALYALLPLGGVFLAGSLLGRSMFHERYLIVVSPAFYLLLGGGIGWQGLRALLSLLVLAAALGLNVVALNNHFFDWRYQKDDLRGLARFIDAQGRDGDLVVTSITRQWLYQHYAKRSLPVYLIPPGEPPAAVAGLDAAVAPYRRIWYLPYASSDVDLAVERWLANNAFPAQDSWFNTARASLAGRAPAANFQSLSLSFGAQLRLDGIAMAGGTVVPGDVAGIAARWQALRPLNATIKASIRLLDARGHVYAQTDPALDAVRPLSDWAPGQDVIGRYGLLVPVDAPPGDYRVELRVYDATGRDLPVAGHAGGSDGASLTLGSIRVERGPVPPPEAQVVVHRTALDFGSVARLAGYDVPSSPWLAGNRVPVTLSWRALDPDGADYQPILKLLDQTGSEVVSRAVAMSALPVSKWRRGEVLRIVDDWRLPPQLPEGLYRLAVGLRRSNGADVPAAGDPTLRAVTIERRPNDAVAVPRRSVDYQVGSFARLVGYDLDGAALPGQTLRLRLYWQGIGETEDAYKVFTHVLSDRDLIAAQHDSMPCDGRCPTTSWVDGDRLADDHILALPADLAPGKYRIAIGLYRESDNLRLPVRDPAGAPVGDRILLDDPE